MDKNFKLFRLLIQNDIIVTVDLRQVESRDEKYKFRINEIDLGVGKHKIDILDGNVYINNSKLIFDSECKAKEFISEKITEAFERFKDNFPSNKVSIFGKTINIEIFMDCIENFDRELSLKMKMFILDEERKKIEVELQKYHLTRYVEKM